MARIIQKCKAEVNARCYHVTSSPLTTFDDAKYKQTSVPKPYEAIPGPPDTNMLMFFLRYTPLVGGLNLNKVHEIGFDKFKKYGPIRKENVPKRFKIVIPYDPDDIEKVFQSDGKCPVRPAFAVIKHYRTKNKADFRGKIGLFTDNPDEWYSIRSKTQSVMMRPKVIASYMPQLNAVADDMISLMRNKRRQDYKIDMFMSQLYNWAMESLGVFALDKRFGCLSDQSTKETKDFIQTINNAVIGLTKTEFGVPTWRYFPTKGYQMIKESQLFMKNLTLKRIEDIREKLKLKKDSDNLSFLESLVSHGKLDEGELLCFIMDLFMAGIDTTAHTFAFFLYNLSKNPDVQEKLYTEIKSIIANPLDEIKPSDVEQMKYLKACLKESMRISASIIGTSRILKDDVVLSNYLVPKGTVFVLQSMVVSNLEMNVKEPSKFIPERWLKGSNESAIHRYAFFPFGSGPRMCIGKRLAEMEIYTLMVKILLNFRIQYDGQMGIITRIVNIPDKPLEFDFCDR